MQIKTKGFSVIEFVMIVVVLVIVGVFVYFASQSKKVDVAKTSPVDQSSVTNNTSVAPNSYDEKFVINSLKQISADAETRFIGNYSKAFTVSNYSKGNGSGIILDNGSVGNTIVQEMAKLGGEVFAITNAKATSYVLYGTLPNTNNSLYYCLGSDGSTKSSTSVVADASSLLKKPYCK